jgi:hypothetical protein
MGLVFMAEQAQPIRRRVGPEEELRLAGMLIDAANGKVDWTAYPDHGAGAEDLDRSQAGRTASGSGSAAADDSVAVTIYDLCDKQEIGNQGNSSMPRWII